MKGVAFGIYKKVSGDAYVEMDTQIFLAIVMNRLSILGIVKKWLVRQIKMKGIRKLLILLKVINLLVESNG